MQENTAMLTIVKFLSICAYRMDARKRYACTLCTKSFTRKYKVNFHIRNHHARLQLKAYLFLTSILLAQIERN